MTSSEEDVGAPCGGYLKNPALGGRLHSVTWQDQSNRCKSTRDTDYQRTIIVPQEENEHSESQEENELSESQEENEHSESSWVEELVNEEDVVWVDQTICEGDEDWPDEEEEEEQNEEEDLEDARRSLSGDLLGFLTIDEDAGSVISCLSNDLGYSCFVSEEVGSTVDLHSLIQQSDWDMLQKELHELELNPSLLRKALMRRSDLNETALHVICCKGPKLMALKVLQTLDELRLAKELIAATFDAAENTVLHAVCAHVRSSKSRRSSRSSSTRYSKSRSRTSKHGGKSRSNYEKPDKFNSPLEPIGESDPTNFADPSEAAESPQEPILDFEVLKKLVTLAPEVLEMTNMFGDTPLHLLVTSPGFRLSSYKKRSGVTSMAAEMAAEEVVVSLLSIIPKEVSVHANHQGLTMLHCAIARGSHELVLVQLLRYGSRTAGMPDSRGMYPLHYVAMKSKVVPWTFAKDLIAAYPEALVAQTYEKGETPLHLLLSYTQRKKREHEKKEHKKRKSSSTSSSKKAPKEFYLDRNTAKLAELLAKSTTDWTDSSSSSISSAPNSPTSLTTTQKRRRCSLNTSEKEVKTCALLVMNQDRLSPLHCCAKVGASGERLTQLLMKSRWSNKACLLQTLVDRYTPLHVACAQKPCCPSTVEALVAGSQACAVQDSQGRTPLATAIMNSSFPSSLVKTVMDAYKKAVEIPSHGNYLPIHLALQHDASESTCKRMIRQGTKKSLEAATVAGDTPLHLACAQSEVSHRVVKLLLAKFPEAIFLRNTAGQSPFDQARAFNPGLIKAVPQLEMAQVGTIQVEDAPPSPTSSKTGKHARQTTRQRKSTGGGGILRRSD